VNSAFGDITKNGNSQFIPGYSPTQNQFTFIPGRNVSYDGNGNLLNGNLNTYTWDVFGRMSTVNTGSLFNRAFRSDRQFSRITKPGTPIPATAPHEHSARKRHKSEAAVTSCRKLTLPTIVCGP
jgi:hypothetical protein